MGTGRPARGLRPLPVLTAVNFFNYLDRQVVYSMTPFLAAQFALSRFQLGWLSFVNLVVFALSSLISGPIADRIGPRPVILYGVLLWSVATIGSALAVSFPFLLFFRALSGVGEGCYGPSAIALLCATVRPDERGRTLGIYNAGMAVGGSAGLFLGAALAPLVGWRGVFLIAGLPSLLLAFATALTAAPTRVARPHAAPAGAYLRNPTFVMATLGGILVTFSAAALLFWARTLIIEERGFSVMAGGLMMLTIGVVCGIGGVITGGYLGDRAGRRRHGGHAGVVGLSLLVAIPLGAGCLLITNEVAFVLLTATCVFLLSMYNGPVGVVIDKLAPPQYAATLQAVFLFGVHILGDAPAASVVGYIGGHTTIAHALLVAVVAFGLAGVLFMVVARRQQRDEAG
jgi:MFS transporter, Spinster family, sphingosine-1-phosphate transporter